LEQGGKCQGCKGKNVSLAQGRCDPGGAKYKTTNRDKNKNPQEVKHGGCGESGPRQGKTWAELCGWGRETEGGSIQRLGASIRGNQTKGRRKRKRGEEIATPGVQATIRQQLMRGGNRRQIMKGEREWGRKKRPREIRREKKYPH